MLRTAATVLVLGLSACATTTRSPRQEVQWFKRGVYVGAEAGVAVSSETGSDLQAELNSIDASIDPTRSSSVVSYDRQDLAYKVYGGYRFERPFLIEGGWVNLGMLESQIASTQVSPTYLPTVADVHPYLGRGFFLGARWMPVNTRRFELGIGGGAWIWEASVDAASGSQTIDVDKDGIDPFFGANILIDLTSWLSLRFDYERYYLESIHADAFTGGVQFRIL